MRKYLYDSYVRTEYGLIYLLLELLLTNLPTPTLSGMPHPNFVTDDERQEYWDLIQIIQNITGIEHISSNPYIMFDKDVKPFCSRILQLMKRYGYYHGQEIGHK